MNERDVVAVDGAILNLGHKLASGLIGLGRQHEARGVAVEPVHDAEPVGLLALHVAEVVLAAVPDKRIDQRAVGMIDRGMADERCRMAVRDVPSAREAITTFRVLERFEAGPKDDGYSLIECKLFTGRTHQIRVHMQYTRHPIVGDPVYNAHGPRDARAQLGLRRQFLHSYSIAFEHPTTGEPMAFADNLPRDLQEALDSLAARSLGKTEAGREVAELMATSPVPSVEGEVPDE